MTIRGILTHLIVPTLKITGFRFDKSYRHAETGWKAFVYRRVSTIGANSLADGYGWPWRG